MMSETDLAYAAGIIDAQATLKLRNAGNRKLPALIVMGGKFRNRAVLWLCDQTGTTVAPAKRRDYERPQCADHCPTPHIHVHPVVSGVRWNVTGMKATIVLNAILPYMRCQKEEAELLIKIGLDAGYSTSVVNTMKRLGWPIPDLKPQPRATVQKEF